MDHWITVSLCRIPIDRCEPPCLCWEANLYPQQEEQVCLSTDPFTQPLVFISFVSITKTGLTGSCGASLLYILRDQQLHSAMAEPFYGPTRDETFPIPQ